MAKLVTAKAALLKNFIAASGGQLSNSIFKVIQIPIFLHYMTVEQYGKWILIYSLPSLLLLGNPGFASVAATKIGIDVAGGQMASAKRAYSTGLALVGLLMGILVLLAAAISFLLPWRQIVGISQMVELGDVQVSAFMLTLAVVVALPNDLFVGCFRAARKAHWAMHVSSAKPWLELIAIAAALHFSTKFATLSAAVFVASLCYSVGFYLVSRVVFPELRFAISAIDLPQVRVLATKGASFQGMAIGNALMLQGCLVSVQATLGPSAVVLFSTARTLVGSVLQTIGMMNNVTWSEFSFLIGQERLAQAIRLHRIVVAFTWLMGFAGTLCLAVWGPQVYSWWTGSRIDMPPQLLWLFLLPIPITAVYSSSAVVHAASNNHAGMALRHVIGSIGSVICCYLLSQRFGIYGAAAAMTVLSLTSARYVLLEALAILGDNFSDFLFGMWRELVGIAKGLVKPGELLS